MGCNCGKKIVKPLVSNTNTIQLPHPEKGDCACKEHHDKLLVQSTYTTTVQVTNTWSMPTVNDCVQLHLKDVTNILPDAILWNASVGRLKVSSYDYTTGYVLACNEGQDGNAEAGTSFPSNMSFHVGIPIECNCDSDYTGACLAADFISPGNNETATMSVNTVTNLYAGYDISVAGYVYTIQTVNPLSQSGVFTIEVMNTGYGAPSGTVIESDPTCSGKSCQVKILVTDTGENPCAPDATTVNNGKVIVCKDGRQRVLLGTGANQILAWDNTTTTWYPVGFPLSATDGQMLHWNNGGWALRNAPSPVTLPSQYSGKDNSMIISDLRTIPNIEIKRGQASASLNSYLPTISLTYPSSLSGITATVIGTITIRVSGYFTSDTHTFNVSSENKKALSFVICPTSSFETTPKFNGENLYPTTDTRTSVITSGDQYHVSVDHTATGETAPNAQFTQTLTIPVVCEISVYTGSVITLPTTFYGGVGRSKDGFPSPSHGDEIPKLVLQRVQTTAALAWILKTE